MKTRSILKLIVLCLATGLSLHTWAECQMKVRVNHAPPQYMEQDGKWIGRAVELMEALLEEAGCQADFVAMPWHRALIQLEHGDIDAMMNVGINDERAKHFHFLYPNTREVRKLLVKKGSNFTINRLEDLKNLPSQIGYEQGVIFDQDFTKLFESDSAFRDKFFASPTGNLPEMILADRLSAELKILETAKYYLETHQKYRENLEIHPFEISSLPTFFAFSKKSVPNELFVKLSEANNKAIAKGKYQPIIRKWED